MKQKTIGIIGGKGKMGKYFVNFFEQNGYSVIISDKRTKLSNIELVKKADVVMISVPIDKTEAIIQEVAPHIKKSGLLMDLTSLKVSPIKAMSKTKVSYLGCHPLFGPTNAIEGQLIILCPGRGQKWFNWWQNLLEKNKVKVKIMPAQKHDKIMAYVQALTHFSDIALADTLRKSKIPIRKMTACQSPVYRLELDMMGRILNQDPNLYANIQIDNPLSASVMQDFIKSCQTLTEIVAKKDNKAFIHYFKKNTNYLGEFAEKAMIESDRLIEEMLGGNSSFQTPPVGMGKKYNLAVLGPANTYSDLAAKKCRPKAKIWYGSSINEIFEFIKKGKIKTGFVPLENSTTGSVRETLDELYNENIWIDSVTAQQIYLALVGIKKVPLKKIKVIYSHPQPLLQSRNFIKKYLPKAACIPMSSTAAALVRVSKEKNVEAVAIGSLTAAKSYNLKTIRSSIEGDRINTTYFAIIGKKPKKLNLTKATKTSIGFNFDKDSPGSLYTVLQDFAEAHINLTKIESRPNPKIAGEYVFYIDFEGNINQPHVKKTLTQVKKRVAKMKVLGSYSVTN